MSTREKFLRKMRENPRSIRFAKLDKLLVSCGFERRQPKGGSSHYIYKFGRYKLVIPKENPVKPIYIKEALEILEQLNIN